MCSFTLLKLKIALFIITKCRKDYFTLYFGHFENITLPCVKIRSHTFCQRRFKRWPLWIDRRDNRFIQ